MNKEELLMAMRKDGMSGVVVKRIERLMGEYATPSAFFTASKGSIMSAYSKIAKGSHGLGKSFWENFDRANAIFKSDLFIPESDGVSHEIREPVDAGSAKMLRLEELKTVVAFMELCDVEAINILEIVGFLGAVKMRQKKPEDQKPAEGAADEGSK